MLRKFFATLLVFVAGVVMGVLVAIKSECVWHSQITRMPNSYYGVGAAVLLVFAIAVWNPQIPLRRRRDPDLNTLREQLRREQASGE